MLQFDAANRESPQLASLDELVSDEDVIKYLESLDTSESMRNFYRAIIAASNPSRILLTAFLIHEKTEIWHLKKSFCYDDSLFKAYCHDPSDFEAFYLGAHFEALESESSYLLENARNRAFDTTKGDILLVNPTYALFYDGQFQNNDWEFYQQRTKDKKRIVDSATLRSLEFYLFIAPHLKEKLEHIKEHITPLAERGAQLHL